MSTVVLVGTLDTKGKEYAFLRDRIREHGVDVILVDAGIVGEPLVEPDVTRDEVAAAAGADVAALAAADDRGAAVEAMARGAAEMVKRLHGEGRLDAIGALGGSGGSALATYAMRQLPIGVPKLMVSTVASGDTSPYVGSVDVTMMYSVVDISGINQISARIMSNAAGALAGMARATVPTLGEERPLVVASMFGVTTPRRHDGARAARGARLRGARLPPDGRGRRVDGGAHQGRVHRRVARRDDDRVLRPGRGRRARRGARAARVGRRPWHPAGRLAGCARHGQLRPHGLGA